MAQASSAQREPSMEEILASIRRIIEDSETGRKDEAQPGAAAESMESSEAEQFQTELRPVNDLRPTLSHDRSELAPARAVGSFPWPSDDNRNSLLREDEVQPEAPSLVGNVEDEREQEPAASYEYRASETHSGPDLTDVPEAEVGMITPSQPAEPTRPTILSAEPGRKVAAAFEELNEALLASRRKSLDQMAEEMLQPMLQDWLDNNLPKLVERLVREEIERIARGG